MESSRVGQKLSSSCPWDRSGSSLFLPIWRMAIAARTRAPASAPARRSFLRWNYSPSRPRTKQSLRLPLHLRPRLRLSLRQTSSAQEVDLWQGSISHLPRNLSVAPGLPLQANPNWPFPPPHPPPPPHTPLRHALFATQPPA